MNVIGHTDKSIFIMLHISEIQSLLLIIYMFHVTRGGLNSVQNMNERLLSSLQMTILSLSITVVKSDILVFSAYEFVFHPYQSHTYTSMYVYTLVFVKLQ